MSHYGRVSLMNSLPRAPALSFPRARALSLSANPSSEVNIRALPDIYYFRRHQNEIGP